MAALAGDEPETARVAQARAVLVEDPLGLFERLDQDDRAVELAGLHEAAAKGVLDVLAQARAHVALYLDALVGLDPQLLDSGAVAVVDFGGHWTGPNYACSVHSYGALSVYESASVSCDRERASIGGEKQMGFLDKAKQMAEQAQQKIEEQQKKFNEQQQQRARGRRPALPLRRRPCGGAPAPPAPVAAAPPASAAPAPPTPAAPAPPTPAAPAPPAPAAPAPPAPAAPAPPAPVAPAPPIAPAAAGTSAEPQAQDPAPPAPAVPDPQQTPPPQQDQPGAAPDPFKGID